MKQKWIPTIDEVCCTGCGECVTACEPASLALVDGMAALIDADACESDEHCLDACERHAIAMSWLNASGSLSRGIWRTRGMSRGGNGVCRSLHVGQGE